MLVDSPLIVDTALGAERRIIEAGDSQLSVPSTVIPALLFLLPTDVDPPATIPVESSALRTSTRSNTNQAQSSDILIQLSPGLWELEYWLDVTSNFTNGFVSGTDTGVRITFETLAAVTLATLIQRHVITNLSSHDYSRIRVLLRQTYELVLRVQITGVGQTILTTAGVNAIRIL